MLKRLLIFTFIFFFTISLSHAWLAGYGFRKQFTVQGTNLDSNQTHFPIMLKLVDSDVDDECDDDGDRSYDIRFTQSDDTVLDVNWIDYSEAGGNATIICAFSDAGWTINAAGSTTGYMYYGNASAGDPATDTGVWDSNFKGVWHLDDATTSTVADSTATPSTGNKQAANEPNEVAGNFHMAQDFDASDDYIDCGSAAKLDDIFDSGGTAEAWIYADGWGEGNNGIIFAKFIGDTDGWALYTSSSGSAIFLNYAFNTNKGRWNKAISLSTQYHIAVSYDNSNVANDPNIYFNGAIQAETESDTPVGTRVTDAALDLLIGERGDNARCFDGQIEEARISDSIRSTDWIKFTYYNINEADNELTWGSEESAPTGYIPKVIIIR